MGEMIGQRSGSEGVYREAAEKVDRMPAVRAQGLLDECVRPFLIVAFRLLAVAAASI